MENNQPKMLGYTPTPTSEPTPHPSNLSLPHGMTLSRYANKETVELIGKYKVDAYDPEPTRVCRILVFKWTRSAIVEINDRQIVSLTAPGGSPSMLEYIAVKALKGYLQYRIAYNAHKMRQRKRRRAEKRAKLAAEAASCV